MQAATIKENTINVQFKVSSPGISEMLLFSNAIASDSDRNVLAAILADQLKKLFNIHDYCIYALGESKKTFWPVLYDSNSNFTRHPGFKRLVNSETVIDENVFGAILGAQGQFIFSGKKWLSDPESGANLAANEIDLGLMTGIPIRLADENIAIMTFRPEYPDVLTAQKLFFRSACSQIAILVSGIIAKDKVKQLSNSEIHSRRDFIEKKGISVPESAPTPIRPQIIGNSPQILLTFQLVSRVAPSDSTVLILGETGTGKELIAQAIHDSSLRRHGPLVKVNCAALPANLIESELFGHERGSFTGAFERRIGKFEMAEGGTLFLDEIGEMPLELQVKLLRALQEREIERVGGRATVRVNVRIIAATNRDLESEVNLGRFRRDLYYRLNIFPIYLAPLRERRQDIPMLAAHFLKKFATKAGKEIKSLSDHVYEELTDYSWPGNIRELEHLMERSVLLCTGEHINHVSIPDKWNNTSVSHHKDIFTLKTLQENERDHILFVLKQCRGKISGKGGAAEILALPPSSLNSRLKKLGVRREHGA